MSQQPQPPATTTSAADSAPAAAPDAHYHMPPINPGQTMGIMGILLAFLGLGPIGLVLSIIATGQSSRANTSTALGIFGIVLNAVASLVALFFAFVIVVFVL